MRTAPAPNIARLESVERRMDNLESAMSDMVWTVKADFERVTGQTSSLKASNRRGKSHMVIGNGVHH